MIANPVHAACLYVESVTCRGVGLDLYALVTMYELSAVTVRSAATRLLVVDWDSSRLSVTHDAPFGVLTRSRLLSPNADNSSVLVKKRK